eukprot:scaffold91153_cov51-Phaeocystis_antarctica.AAC.1
MWKQYSTGRGGLLGDDMGLGKTVPPHCTRTPPHRGTPPHNAAPSRTAAPPPCRTAAPRRLTAVPPPRPCRRCRPSAS